MVVLFASQLAGFAGLHKYKDVQQAILDQWYRSDPRGCAEACRSFGPAPGQLLQAQPEYAPCLRAAVDAPDSAALEDVLEDIQDAAVREAVRHDANLARGTRDEAGALDAFEDMHSVRLTDRNDRLHTRDVLLPSGRTVRVMGRIDGQTEPDEIVEVKNRQRHFFDRVPLYERIQVQLYLLLTGASRCKFVQCLDGELREETMVPDTEFLERVVWPEVDSSLDVLERALADDEDEQRRLLHDRLPEKYHR